jgi:hypothetical protein
MVKGRTGWTHEENLTKNKIKLEIWTKAMVKGRTGWTCALYFFLYLFYPFLCLGACWYLHQKCTSNIDDIRIVEIACIYAFKLFCLTNFILRHTWKLSNIQPKVKKNLELRRKNMVKKNRKNRGLSFSAIDQLQTVWWSKYQTSYNWDIMGIQWECPNLVIVKKDFFMTGVGFVFFRHSGDGVNTPG